MISMLLLFILYTFISLKSFVFFMTLIMIFLFLNFNINEVMLIECGFLVDKFSLMLLILCIFIWLMMLLSEFNKISVINLFKLIFMLLILGVGLVFIVGEYLTFYMMFEITLIPMFIYIIFGGGSFDRLEAGIYMLLYTLLVSFPLMMNIFMIFFDLGSMFMFFEMSSGSLGGYIFILLSFMVKLPMYMFHLWLPKAHVEASVSGSMLLAGVMLKMGGYGVLRFMYSLKSLFILYSFIFISLSLLGSGVASVESLRFMDMKILVAYSSIVHMGIMIVGILSMSVLGLMGGLLLMISHGICSSGLFGVVNLFYERSGTRSMFFNKGGLILSSFMLFFWFILCVNNISSPPSINLFSELFIIGGFINLFFNLLLLVMLIMFWGGVYSIYLFSFSQYGKVSFNIILKSFFNMREVLLMLMHVIPLNFMFLVMDLYI
uniref:NADH-ubiquinone oxidoreductase chain 4 n=1 Tax=Ceraphronidae sp. ZJUH_2016007 TaxID=2491153 RepID=A0A3Q8U9X3_9HYME|nr:NADH dehydrogenase subunit 4 [Ceraphronidae sp. ZJUH_2016007]